MKETFKPTVVVKPDKRRPLVTNGKDKFFRLCAVAYFNENGKPYQDYYRLPVDCTLKDYAAARKSPLTGTDTQKEIAKQIKIAETKIDDILQSSTVTRADFKHYFQTIETGADVTADKNIWALFAKKIKEEETHSPSNALLYVQSMASFKKFAPNLRFRDITKRWLENYTTWCLNQNISYGSINFYMQPFRAIYRRAIKEKIYRPDVYPFGGDGYQLKKSEGRKIALDLYQFRALKKLQESNNGFIQYGLDFWFLSFYLCGMNNADVTRLKYKDIQNNLLRKVRHKTRNTSGKELRLPLENYEDEINTIIKHYGVKYPPDEKPQPNDYVFPFLAKPNLTEKQKRIRANMHLTKVNDDLTEVQEILGLPFELRTYSARHTFARLYLQVQKGTKKELQFLLGHASITTTEIYCKDWVENETISQNLGEMKKQLAEPAEPKKQKRVVMKINRSA